MITLAFHDTRTLLIDKPRKRSWGIVGMHYDLNNSSHQIHRKKDLLTLKGPNANV